MVVSEKDTCEASTGGVEREVGRTSKAIRPVNELPVKHKAELALIAVSTQHMGIGTATSGRVIDQSGHITF